MACGLPWHAAALAGAGGTHSAPGKRVHAGKLLQPLRAIPFPRFYVGLCNISGCGDHGTRRSSWPHREGCPGSQQALAGGHSMRAGMSGAD